MTKETGPREKALREMREAKFSQKLSFDGKGARAAITDLKRTVEAARKRSKPRKKK